jgi:hypothetical protein
MRVAARLVLLVVVLPVVLYLVWVIYTNATEGCVAPPFTLDACRDPYTVMNETKEPVTIYRVDAAGHEVEVASLRPGSLPLQINRGGPRCQDFNLVARDSAGRELARRNRWCRFDEWVIPVSSP